MPCALATWRSAPPTRGPPSGAFVEAKHVQARAASALESLRRDEEAWASAGLVGGTDDVFGFDEDEDFVNNNAASLPSGESGVTQQQPTQKGGSYKSFKCLSSTDVLSGLPLLGPVAQAQAVVSHFERLVSSDASGVVAAAADVEELAAALHHNGLAAHVVLPDKNVSTYLHATGRIKSARVPELNSVVSPYIVIPAASGDVDADVIVDPAMRAWLMLGGETTSHYSKKAAALPNVFVGMRADLRSRVNEMATAISLNFTVQGLTVPPWRSRQVLLQRWGLDGSPVASATAADLSRSTSSSSFDDLLRTSMEPLPAPAAAVAVVDVRVAVTVDDVQHLRRRESDTGSEMSEDMAISPVSVLMRQAPAMPWKDKDVMGWNNSSSSAVQQAAGPRRIVGFAL